MIDVAPNYMRGTAAPRMDEYMEAIVSNAYAFRTDLMRQFFDPRRDIDDECGYPRSEGLYGSGAISPDFYRALYMREPVAARVVELMPKECWAKPPAVFETEDSDDVTPFEEDWDALGQQLRGEECYYQDEEGSPVWDYLRRANILSGIGHFGVILLGFDDGKMLDQPVDGVVSMDPDGRPMVGNALEVGSQEAQVRTVWEPDRDAKGRWKGTFNVRTEPYVDIKVANELPSRHQEQGTQLNPREPTGPMNPRLPGTGLAPNYGTVGTDAQYAGVQLGPPEFPAAKPATEKRKLLFLRVFDEPLVQIVQYEANVASPRFGRPVMYRITLNDPREQHSGIGLPMATIRVHWSRVVHLNDSSENPGSSEVFSPPRMRPVLNRLLDLRKLYAGSAEMYWKGAFPGISLETVPQLGGDVRLDRNVIRDDLENYSNGLQRWMVLMGLSAKMLSPTVVDPSAQIATQIEAICIKLGCPIRVFKGAERGELASSQDDDNWNDRKREYQNNYLTPRVVVPFIDRLIQAGVLSPPTKSKKEGGDVGTENRRYRVWRRTQYLTVNGTWQNEFAGSLMDRAIANAIKSGTKPLPEKSLKRENTVIETGSGYSVEWPDLDSLGAKDKSAIALSETQALAAYVAGNVESMLPPQEYMVHILGWTEEQAEAVLDAAKQAHEAMDTMTAPPMVQGQPAEAPPGTQAKADKDQQAKQAQALAAAKQPPGAVAKKNATDAAQPATNGKLTTNRMAEVFAEVFGC